MDKPPRKIDVLLFDDVNVLDVAGPVQAFTSANEAADTGYRLRYVTMDGKAVTASCGLRLAANAAATSAGAQDLLVPGGPGVRGALGSPELIRLVATWPHEQGGARIISICSGALILARAGLLDGRTATTHWSRTQQARALFTKVSWSTDLLYYIDGPVMTSAGVSSGIDLALEIIRRDHGSAVALAVARELVVYLKRTGGQRQFADLLEAQFSGDAGLARLTGALQEQPGRAWTLETMADAAGLTPRTLSRRFTEVTGHSPVKFLERYRVKRASDVLAGGAPVGSAIAVAGFSDFQQMQRAFKRHLGTTVGNYRDRFAESGQARI